MNIVILDGYTLNPGDLDWTNFEKLGNVKIYKRTPANQVIERAKNAEIILTNKTIIDKNTIKRLSKQLKYIGVLATGYDVVDIEQASIMNIPVTNVPTYGTQSVAQMAFAHILNLAHHITEHSQGVKNDKWSSAPDFCYWEFPLIDLANKTLGIVGFGRIGQATANLGKAFEMNILIHKPTPPASLPDGIRYVELDEIFSESDVISFHCPLNSETENMVNSYSLSLMKPSAFLINTSRGGLIDEEALANSLHSGEISGAGLDVLASEPPQPDSPLLSAPNCYITPHIAWATKEARCRLINSAFSNLETFLRGRPQNVVNMKINKNRKER
jgi:glycerate dehydrogenase